AVMSGRPYEVSAETLSPALVTFIGREQFTQLLSEHGGVCASAAQQLNRDYHAAYEKARLLGLSGSTTGKLARLLLQLAARRGTQTERGIRMKVALTHEELGQLIGASRETVTRLLGEFKSREILQTKGAIMLLRDRQALEALLAT
ncbi:MAG TPA: Crp/Fnr family transcriptional regulator, partial [Pyrinomonadaceae bacterium]